MSQRVKRPNRCEDGSLPVKRRKRTVAEEEEAASLAAAWQPRSNDNRIYNRTTTEAPAELFRKDLISAMKLPDSEPLSSDEYWVIVDQWKQEWERGVQVPVNPDSLPEPSVTVTRCTTITSKPQHEFKLPKNKYIRITKDDNFKIDDHVLSNAPTQSEDACSYDLDEFDVAWLRILNAERATCGLGPIHEDQLERVIERFELFCWDKIQLILRDEEGLGIEFDENVICDVCRSPDSEEGNEMVFCDSCNICVHQACYGITRIPEGQWLCCTCHLSKRPKCVLCPNKGGAMKCTRSGQKWAHVSCALWIPEVSIGCVEKMEPITKISSIPASRWALICVLCRERVGACIQCSVKTCKTAYHVTCAFKHGLEMRAIIEDENADDGVKLRSYCEKHSKSSKKEKSICSSSEDDDSKRRKRKDMTSEEKNQARAARLQEIEAEFYEHVSMKDVCVHLNVDNEALQYIYNYWKLKRKAGYNKPLLLPKSEDIDMLSHKREQADLEKMKMFVQLRQDLERVRNLCYMVSRREKLSRTFFRMREQTFHKQSAVMANYSSLPSTVLQAVVEANHGPSIYDRLYSHDKAEDHTTDFDVILARISGMKSPPESSDEKKPEINGLFRDVKNNPYKKEYFNGSTKRRSERPYSSMSSASSSDERPKDNKENRMISSSDEKPSISPPHKKKSPPKKQNISKVAERRRRSSISTQVKIESSSEDDIKPIKTEHHAYSRSKLSQMEDELGISGTDSDDLVEMRIMRKTDNHNAKMSSTIYSDSDSSDASMKNDDKSSNATSDSQQNRLRTKASVKEFSHKPSTSKGPNKASPENKKKIKVEDVKKEVSPKKKDCTPSDLIVPQRQAAKKATENLKSNTTTRPKEPPVQVEEQPPKIEEKPKPIKPRNKSRESKDNVEIVKEKEPTPSKDKEIKKVADIFDIDKEMEKLDTQEILAYVPQRQAAKKAAEHIKSGLGKPVPSADPSNNNDSDKAKKESEPIKAKKDVEIKSKKEPEIEKPARVSENKRKSSSNSSSSSSSSSSSDSSSSSSSESEDEPPPPPPPPAKQQARSESLSSSSRDTTKRANAKDRPFLDRGSKSAASSSSSDSDNSTPSPPPKKPTTTPPQPKTDSSPPAADNKTTPPVVPKTQTQQQPRKTADKKHVTPPVNREDVGGTRPKGRPGRGRPRSSNVGDRVGNADVRAGDLSGGKRVNVDKERGKSRKGKQLAGDALEHHEPLESTKKTTQSGNLLSPLRKTTKKLNDKIESEEDVTDRKSLKEVLNKTKMKLDRLFGPSGSNEKAKALKTENEKQINSALLKENKEHGKEKDVPKKSLVKNKNINDIFADKFLNCDNRFSNKKTSQNLKKPLEVPISETTVDNHSRVEVKVLTASIASPNKVPLVEIEIQKNTENKQAVQNMKRSIFSPQHKDTDLIEFGNFDDGFGITKDDGFVITKDDGFGITKDDGFGITKDDGFGIAKEEDILKGPLTFSFGNANLIKEDTKEDNARETLNLVEKLRMGLSKKPTTCEVDDVISISSSSNKNDSDRTDFLEQVVPSSACEDARAFPDNKSLLGEVAMVNLEMRVEVSGGGASSKPFATDHNTDYRYVTCEADVPLEPSDKNVVPPIEQHHGSTENLSVQGDERWVPPSENYPGLQVAMSYANNVALDTHLFMEQYSNNQHHKTPSATIMLPEAEAFLHSETLKNHPELFHEQSISQNAQLMEPLPDIISSNSAYLEMHAQQPTWAENVVLPNRRSSSSSAASSSSSCSRKNDDEDNHKLGSEQPSDVDIGMVPLQSMKTYQPSALESFPYSEQSPFVNSVSLFAAPNLNTQLPFPSSGAAVFPSAFGAPFPVPHSVMSPILSKPQEESMQYSSSCTAAFTSSQHNMALTAAMVNMPSKEPEPIIEEPLPPATTPLVIEPPSPIVTAATPIVPTVTTAAVAVTSSPSPSVRSNASSGKKSPSKPTRTSARVTSQMKKSPNKSPGKSPRQEVTYQKHGNSGRRDNKRGSGKTSIGRGSQYQSKTRGRGKGRGRNVVQPHLNSEYDFVSTNTIHNKLAGTVYDLDFDDDSNENMTDLKSMRERRKSVDNHERKIENSYFSKDASDSPKFASPTQGSHKNRTYNVGLSELRPPTPLEDSKEASPVPSPNEECKSKTDFSGIVPPFLPGPVDMRTYNSYDQQTYNETNLLNAFAAGTTETHVHEDIDEEEEKEFHAALRRNEKAEQTIVPDISNIKVSLSDSRNQLKVKIKGPIANYTSTVAPLPTPTVDPIVVSNITATSSTINAISNVGMGSGTSNLRRMRKKELLRQYWTQDMNMDDPASVPVYNTPTVPPLNRTTITIPKAVTSVTSIPTKDDYRDYRTGSDDFLETKQHRKETKIRSGGLTRELRQLEVTMDDEHMSDRRRSSLSVVNNTHAGLDATFNKRRGRPPRLSQQLTTPKLKIKFGNNMVATKIDDRKDKVRPPKKRLTTTTTTINNKPTVEEMKRESMKYRKLVMANFGQEKRKKRDKSEKRKRKKSKQQVQIIPNESENPTKLIIRFNKKVESETTKRTSVSENMCLKVTEDGLPGASCRQDSSGAGSNGGGGTSLPKITPIKLKLSRCQEGSGYIMKPASLESFQTTAEETQATQPGQPPPAIGAAVSPPPISLSEAVHAPTSLPLNKDCEVR